MINSPRLFIYLLFITVISCSHDDDATPHVTSVLGTDAFDEEKSVVYTLDERFTLDLWAPGPLLSNAVALSFDNHGNAYVAETNRRKSSDIDIRQHSDWMVEDLALESIDDTREFHLRKLATELSDRNEWQEDFNEDGIHDYRDLSVQSETIRKVYDTDGDGRADASHLYTEGINDMLTTIAAGVLYHDDRIYVTAAPDLYSFGDLDDDGDADEREVISTGYGIHIAFAGHDMSGLTMGPDGKLYWSIGDMGMNVTDETGKNWKYAHEGSVMRCYPDGSDFEVFAHGLRNPQEITFDAYGNLFTVDNDGDHAGEKERYVHILEGSDSGWRINWQYGKYGKPYEDYKIWMDENLSIPYHEGQAAYIIPPIALADNGPAGLAYNPGTAMGEAWNHTFFTSYFTGNNKNSKITSFQVQAKGSSFEVNNEQEVLVGINGTGINFGPDGALYINDWKESYDKKEEGRIWKLDTKKRNDKRSVTKSILQRGATELSIENLSTYLDNDDIRVRQMAQFELVNRKEAQVLLQYAKDEESIFARLHAIWGYGQLLNRDQDLLGPIIPLLDSQEDHVRAQVAKVLGDAAYHQSGPYLRAQLDDTSPYVLRHIIEAIGKVGDIDSYPFLIAHLENISESRDPFMRHTIAYALSKIDDGRRLQELNKHESVDVRIGAVLALRHLRSAAVAKFLNDSNPLVITEAARAINDDASIPEAIEALAGILKTTPYQKEPLIRRAINANLRIADAASADRLAAYVMDKAHDMHMREDALWTLGYWDKPPVLDRVDNQYRELDKGDLAAAQRAFKRIYESYSEQDDLEFKSMILTVSGKLKYREAETDLIKYVEDVSISEELRVAALHSLAMMDSRHLTESIRTAISDESTAIRIEAQAILDKVKIPPAEKVELINQILKKGSVKEKQSIIKTLAKITSPEAENRLADLVKNLPFLEKEIKLDVMQAAEAYETENITSLIEAYKSAKKKANKLSQYAEALYGGDPMRGQAIFAYNESAQCLRCHQVKDYGGEVGPPLDNIGSVLTREDILLSLIDPSARIAPGYGMTSIVLLDGRELLGTVTSETPTELILKDGNGMEVVINTSHIRERENLPSGMFSQENILSLFEIRDLVSFLVGLE